MQDRRDLTNAIRFSRCALSLAVVAAGVWLAGKRIEFVSPEPSRDPQPDRLAQVRGLAQRIAPVFSAFVPTDWSKAHPEELAQSLDQYVASKPNRPNSQRTTLYLQPVGSLTATQERVMTATQELLALWFGTPVKTLPVIAASSIPARAKRVHPQWKDPQLLADYLLYEAILPRRPEDAVAVLGLTATDLWPGEGWNFVFGQASLRDRIGVWSLYRYGDPERSDADYRRYLLRALKVATHETGHMFSIPHCVSFQCGMNGSNHLPEADAAPFAFCPECTAKLWWATGTDPVSWLRSLRDFCSKNGLNKEGAIWNDCLRALGE